MTVQQLRYLIPDIEEIDWEDTGTPSYLFSDEHLASLLELNNGRVKRAAADAISAIAVSEALISKVIKTEDLQTDGAKVATALFARARQLREDDREDDLADDQSFFEIVPFRHRRRCGPILTEPVSCVLCGAWCRCR